MDNLSWNSNVGKIGHDSIIIPPPPRQFLQAIQNNQKKATENEKIITMTKIFEQRK